MTNYVKGVIIIVVIIRSKDISFFYCLNILDKEAFFRNFLKCETNGTMVQQLYSRIFQCVSSF